jgi:DNA-directed RNA polymerase specialized sigma subunit
MKMPRREISCAPSTLALLSSDAGDPAQFIEVIEVVEMRSKLKDYVDKAIDEDISERSRAVIEGLYFENATLEELAVRFGRNHRSTICRWHALALLELKTVLERTECPILWRRFSMAKARLSHPPIRG